MSTDAATFVAGSVAAGVSAVTVAALGIEPQQILWSAVGASIGIVGTKPATRVRAVVVFIATVLAGALLATAAAHYWQLGTLARNLIALALGPVFPVAQERLAERVPSVVDWALDLVQRIVQRRVDR
jgi:MFS family permease